MQAPCSPCTLRWRSYSGPTAAFAYRNMDLTGIDRIFILGPSHHFYLRGCALTGCVEYQTPCGNLRIDQVMNEELLAMVGAMGHEECLTGAL